MPNSIRACFCVECLQGPTSPPLSMGLLYVAEYFVCCPCMRAPSRKLNHHVLESCVFKRQKWRSNPGTHKVWPGLFGGRTLAPRKPKAARADNGRPPVPARFPADPPVDLMGAPTPKENNPPAPTFSFRRGPCSATFEPPFDRTDTSCMPFPWLSLEHEPP